MKAQISSAVEFVIRFAAGGEARVETYSEAIELLRARGCQEIGHTGDLEDGGDRTLAWLTAADAQNDDGARSFAAVTGRYQAH